MLHFGVRRYAAWGLDSPPAKDFGLDANGITAEAKEETSPPAALAGKGPLQGGPLRRVLAWRSWYRTATRLEKATRSAKLKRRTPGYGGV